MAYHYLMSVDCGSHEAAETLAQAFDRTPVEHEGNVISFHLWVEPFKDEGGEEWFVNLLPLREGNGDRWPCDEAAGKESRWPAGGPSDGEEKAEAVAWGREMFARLERTNVAFLFATIGVECNEWRTSPQVVNYVKNVGDDRGAYDLVISDVLWQNAGSPASWQQWNPGYLLQELRFV